MDFDQLRYFISVVQAKNFTAASKNHHISQPAISRRIADLETELGCKLLVRDSHSVSFTDAGKEFYEYAVFVLSKTDIITQRLDNIAKGRVGHVTVSVVPTSAHIIRIVMAEFYRRFPDIQVDLNYCQGKDQIASIRQGQHDFYFSFQSLLEAQGSLQILTTDYDRFELYVPGMHAHIADPRDLSSMNFLPLIVESAADAPFLVEKILDICQPRGFDISHTVTVNSFQSVIDLVNAGIGFTVFPHATARSTCTDHLVAFPIQGADALHANALAWNPAAMNDSTIRFLQVCQELFQNVTKPKA